MRHTHPIIEFWTVSLVTVMLLTRVASAVDRSATAPVNSPPANCHPCLFYSGDWDGFTPGANSVYNVRSYLGFGGVYAPFTVPEGKMWEVTGLLVNLMTYNSGVPAYAYWELRSNVSSGNAGTLLAHGHARASNGGAVNCAPFSFNCFTLEINHLDVALDPGEYWLEVLPDCGMSLHQCSSNVYFLLTVDDEPPAHQYGPPEPKDDSYFTESGSGYYFFPTWGQSGLCGEACDRFSVGAMGIETTRQ